MLVTIDSGSGFCFGVTSAVQKAEEELLRGPLYCLGDIVHNGQEVERLAISKDVHSFRADTNYDNERMQRLFEKMGFTYCGKISYPQGQRMAYEKLLV